MTCIQKNVRLQKGSEEINLLWLPAVEAVAGQGGERESRMVKIKPS